MPERSVRAQRRGVDDAGRPSPTVASDRAPGEPSRPGDGLPTWWQGAAVTAVALVLAVGLVLGLWLLARPLALLLAAIILANALAPAVEWLERRLPRPLAVGLAYLLLVAALAGLVAIVVPRLIDQVGEVLANAPELIGRARDLFLRWSPAIVDSALTSIGAWLPVGGGALVEVPLTAVQLVAEAVLVLVMSVYWSIASEGLRRFGLSLVPWRHRDQAADVAHEVVATMGGYVRARAVVAVIVAAVVYVGLVVLGVDYPLALALLAGLGELIPYLGPTAAAVPALAIAVLDSPLRALGVLILYTAVQQLKGYVLVPHLVRRHADIPPLLVIFALLFGTSVGGVVGALVAPPLAGALRVVILRVAAPPLRRRAEAGSTSSVQRSTSSPHAEC
jgi:predicted PurR-regulated permease PerM